MSFWLLVSSFRPVIALARPYLATPRGHYDLPPLIIIIGILAFSNPGLAALIPVSVPR
jgi:hypothetical protein